MAKKEEKTNAMRILDSLGIDYNYDIYDCGEFIDGVHAADIAGTPHEIVFKTITTVGKSGQYHVMVLPIEDEIDFKKAARAAGEKAIEMLPMKDLTKVTGYVRGGCTAIGMKKNYPVIIQETALLYPEIAVSGGRVGVQLRLNPEDYAGAVNGKFEDIIKD